MKEVSLKTLDDLSLVRLSSENRDAVAVLISRYIPLINKLAFQFVNVLDFDDLVQEGSLGLLDAISHFDPEKDVKFSSYANVCIRNKMLKAVDKATSLKSGQGIKNIPLDLLKNKGSDLTPESILIGKENLFSVLKDVKTALSPMEREVLFLHLGGMDYLSIAKELGVKEKSVDNALQRVRRKLKTLN